LIIATGLIGAEQAVRAIGLLIGGYPNELEIMQGIKEGNEFSFQWSYAVYLVLIAGIAFSGIRFQYIHKNNEQFKLDFEEKKKQLLLELIHKR